MFSSLQQLVFVKQTMTHWQKKQLSPKTIVVSGMVFGMLSLSACQTAPNNTAAMRTTSTQPAPTSQPSMPSMSSTPTVTQAPMVETEDENEYPVEPYVPPEQPESPNPLTQETPVFTPPAPVVTQPDTSISIPSRNDYIISEPPAPSHNELLEQARKNSQQRAQRAASNNSTLPAFRNLMQVGINQLKSGQLTNAESSFTRAQRLAPKSSAVYFYLAQVALKKNQPRKAEAMARRGLSVSQDSNRRRALWQIVLQSGLAQNNSRVVSEAKQALR